MKLTFEFLQCLFKGTVINKVTEGHVKAAGGRLSNYLR